MAQKAVRKLTVKVGETTYKLISGSPNAGYSGTDIDVTDFEDTEQVRLPHPQPSQGNIALVIADDGQGEPPPYGIVEEYEFTTIYMDGTSDTPLVKKITGWFGEATPGTIEVAGERRPVWNCDFRKVGKAAVTTTTAG